MDEDGSSSSQTVGIEEWKTARLRVLNLCCESEVRIVDNCFQDDDSVRNVRCNVIGRMAILEYNTKLTNVESICQKLNDKALSVTVRDTNAPNEFKKEPLISRKNVLFLCWQICLFSLLLFFEFNPWVDTPDWTLYTTFALCVITTMPALLKGCYVSIFKRFTIDTTVLITLTFVGACLIQEWFDAALVVIIYDVGGVLESACYAYVRNEVGSSYTEQPSTAVLANGESVDVNSVKIGTRLTLGPGDRVPIDGIVTTGTASVDEHVLTGEAEPKEKVKGSKLSSGSVLQNGSLEYDTTATVADSTLSKIQDLVDEAQSSKTNVGRLVDKVAAYYTPLVITGAVLAIVVPIVFMSDYTNAYIHVNRGLVLIAMACPCALLLAAPMPVTFTIAAAAKAGVLMKSGEALEQMATLTTVGFDKTGTLTEGKFRVMACEPVNVGDAWKTVVLSSADSDGCCGCDHDHDHHDHDHHHDHHDHNHEHHDHAHCHHDHDHGHDNHDPGHHDHDHHGHHHHDHEHGGHHEHHQQAHQHHPIHEHDHHPAHHDHDHHHEHDTPHNNHMHNNDHVHDENCDHKHGHHNHAPDHAHCGSEHSHQSRESQPKAPPTTSHNHHRDATHSHDHVECAADRSHDKSTAVATKSPAALVGHEHHHTCDHDHHDEHCCGAGHFHSPEPETSPRSEPDNSFTDHTSHTHHDAPHHDDHHKNSHHPDVPHAEGAHHPDQHHGVNHHGHDTHDVPHDVPHNHDVPHSHDNSHSHDAHHHHHPHHDDPHHQDDHHHFPSHEVHHHHDAHHQHGDPYHHNADDGHQQEQDHDHDDDHVLQSHPHNGCNAVHVCVVPSPERELVPLTLCTECICCDVCCRPDKEDASPLPVSPLYTSATTTTPDITFLPPVDTNTETLSKHQTHIRASPQFSSSSTHNHEHNALAHNPSILTDTVNYHSFAESMKYVTAVETVSPHPLAAAIVNFSLTMSEGSNGKPCQVSECIAEKFAELGDGEVNTLPKATAVKLVPGQGITGKIGDFQITVGNAGLMQSSGVVIPTITAVGADPPWKLWDPAWTIIYLAVNKSLIGVMGLWDTPRPVAIDMINECRATHLHTVLLTGDTYSVAKSLFDCVKLDSFHSQMTPENKLNWVKQQLSVKKKVGMVGDGINDGPALKQATIGIAMGAGGTAVANSSADIILLADEIQLIPTAIRWSRWGNFVIIWNIILTMLIKITLVIAATQLELPIWVALLADLATIIVIVVVSVILGRVVLSHHNSVHTYYKSKVAYRTDIEENDSVGSKVEHLPLL